MMNRILGVALAAILLAGRTEAVDYHLDALKGSDGADGKSPAAAWQTIAKLNQSSFAAQDRILLKGGQLHAGTITVTAAGITITSFGGERAIIDGGSGSGIVATGITGLTVADLEIRGKGRKTGNDDGVGVKLHECRDTVVERVEAYGFQHSGVKVSNSENVRLERVLVHDNGFSGIQANGKNLTIRRCRAINNPGHPKVTNNHSGNGIVVTGSDILIEECEAAGNGWDQTRGKHGNGPVGIWCHDAERVTIRRCISHHNKSTAGDGGGFDFDGGTRDSLIEHCYSYENQGPGYLVWEYGSRDPIARNIIRYNVSINDRHAGIHIGKSGGADVEDLQVYHNTVITNRGPAVMISGAWVHDKFEPNAGLQKVYIRNNILIGPKDGKIVDGPGGARFEGNLYWSNGGGFKATGHEDFAAWVKATGQETVAGKVVGLHADPKLADFKLVPQLTDPDRLADLFAFMLTSESPAIDRGLDLKKLFKLDAGGKDIFGNPAPQGKAPDIGAHELK